MTRHPKLRQLLVMVPRLAALLATSYFLIATSPPYDPSQSQTCFHASQSVRYHVTGTCGPEGDIVVSSATDECAVAVQGAGAVGLPSAGRFAETSYSTVSLSSDAWTLSGYLPEAALPDAGAAQPDSGPFTVIRDAQATSDLGGFSVIPGAGTQPATGSQHPAPVLRTCTYRRNYPQPSSLVCTGGSLANCEAVLNPL